MVTKQDIAKTLNVSRGSVSQVLNNTTGTRISTALRQRIIQTAKEMGYADPVHDGGINSAKIAYLLCWSHRLQHAPGYWHMSALYEFQRIAAAQGQQIIFMTTTQLPIAIDQAIEEIDRLAPTGVVLDGVVPESLVEKMIERKTPFITTGVQPYAYEDQWKGKLSTLAIDLGQGMKKLITELRGRGSKTIGLMIGPTHFYYNQLLLAHYKEHIQACGMEYQPGCIQICDLEDEVRSLDRYAELGIPIDGLICAVNLAPWISIHLRMQPSPTLDEHHLAVFGNLGLMQYAGKRDLISFQINSQPFAQAAHDLLMYATSHPGKHKRVLETPMLSELT